MDTRTKWSIITGCASEVTFFDSTIARKSARNVELTDSIRKSEGVLRRLRGQAGSSSRVVAKLVVDLEESRAELAQNQAIIDKTNIARSDTEKYLKELLKDFEPKKHVKIMDISDLVAIAIIADLRKHNMLKFTLGGSARDRTTLMSVASFMGIFPELTSDRIYALLADSNEIELVQEFRRR